MRIRDNTERYTQLRYLSPGEAFWYKQRLWMVSDRSKTPPNESWCIQLLSGVADWVPEDAGVEPEPHACVVIQEEEDRE